MTIKTFGELALILEDLMRTHDWYYEHSDDHRVWLKGKAEENKISLLLHRMRRTNPQETNKLYSKLRDKYSPFKG